MADPRTAAPQGVVVCVDVGSTCTKAAAVDGAGRLIGTAQSPTTSGTDVLDGLAAAVGGLGCGPVADHALLVCSSAGGGLRLAVVGQERVVSVEAGRRVALSAGALVVGTWAGALDAGRVEAVQDAAPDVVLLVGGTDGGDRDVLLHNARAIGRSGLRAPVVVAGNAEAASQAAGLVARRGRAVLLADNVIPRIGELAADSARAAIRELFIGHVIGGKGLSRGRRFARLVRCATPDAVLAGVEALAAVARPMLPTGRADLLVVDVGGATTDVFSVMGESADEARSAAGVGVVGQAPGARTVEGDLGVRWSALDLLAAAGREGLLPDPAPDLRSSQRPSGLRLAAESAPPLLTTREQSARRRVVDVGFVPASEAELAEDLDLARLAATIAVRRHARPGSGGRDLRNVGLVVGSGGVLRHADPALARQALAAVISDRAGGWALPLQPRLLVDADYLLAPLGLLTLSGRPDLAVALASTLVGAGAIG